MKLGNYGLAILEGDERNGYVYLPHGKQYSVQLYNDDARRCDALVEIDGKVIGTFRLPARQCVSLETPPGGGGKFTFYSSSTEESAKVGESNIAVLNKGLVRVTFTPEKDRPRPISTVMSMSKSRGAVGQSVGSFSYEPEVKTAGGITGMSGRSDQKFTDVGPIEYDLTGRTIISLRLVTAADDGPRPLVSRPALANPVPPPV